MQPTPRTSTWSSSPASLTAFSRPSFTPLELEDMQPAAMQQRTTYFFRAARSFCAISFRSSITMAGPSFHMCEHALGCLPRRDGPVIHCRRGDAARADAAGGEQRDIPVRRGFPGLNPRLLLNRREQFVRPFDITGRAQANDARVPALGFQREEMVKSGDAVHAAGRQFEPVGDEQQQVVIEEAEQFLRLVQHLDQRVLLELMLLDMRFKNLEALVAAGVLQYRGQPIFLLM